MLRRQRKRNNRNYYFKNYLAYTEDHIRVNNIFVFNVPRTVSKKDIIVYFAKFGEVTSVRLIADRKRSRRNAPKIAFVNFAEASAAAEVLRKRNHSIHSQHFKVKACDSWKQPEVAEKFVTRKNIPEAGIFMLSDDCLLYICKLCSLRDQVHLSQVCTRFHAIFKLCCRTHYKVLDVTELRRLTLWEIHELLEAAGPFIHTLNGFMPIKDRERVLEFIIKYCTKLKHINFSCSGMKSNTLYRLIETQKNTLSEVSFHDAGLNDNSIRVINRIPNLEKVTLSRNNKITGKYLFMLRNLTKLDICSCLNISARCFMKAIENFQNLTYLDIRQCYRLTSELYADIVPHFPNLEVLKMPCTDTQSENVANLPRLKHLEILSWLRGSVCFELFRTLGDRPAELEILKIAALNYITDASAEEISKLVKLKILYCGNNWQMDDLCLKSFTTLVDLEEIVLKNCILITDAGLLLLLNYCHKLRHVNVQRCLKITNAFVIPAIVLLKYRVKWPVRPVIIYVTRSGVTQDVLRLPDVAAARSHMRLVFGLPRKGDLKDRINVEILEFLRSEYCDGKQFDVDSLRDDDLYCEYDAHSSDASECNDDYPPFYRGGLIYFR